MGYGKSGDPLDKVLRVSDHAESVLEYERKEEEARRAAAQAADELSKAQQALGKRARGVAYHDHPITSAFEFVLILLALRSVAIAALIWQTFFGDAEPGVNDTPGHHHDEGSEVPGFNPGGAYVVVVPAGRLHGA